MSESQRFVMLPAEEMEKLVEGAVKKALAQSGGLVDKQELAQKLGCSPKHVDFLRGQGLPTVHVSPKVVRFELARVIEWLAARGPANDT